MNCLLRTVRSTVLNKQFIPQISNARVRYAVAKMPGVLSAEPFRSVAARLRFEHRTHTLGILRLPADAQLRRLLDSQLHRLPLPIEGLLLTQKLGEILGVRVGDRLTIEVLEGDRPSRTVPVAGFVDELLGVSAYMEIHALNRLLQEGVTISDAWLRVDDQQLDPLYQQLKHDENDVKLR